MEGVSLSSLFYPGRKLERGEEKEDQEKGSSYFLVLLFPARPLISPSDPPHSALRVGSGKI